MKIMCCGFVLCAGGWQISCRDATRRNASIFVALLVFVVAVLQTSTTQLLGTRRAVVPASVRSDLLARCHVARLVPPSNPFTASSRTRSDRVVAGSIPSVHIKNATIWTSGPDGPRVVKQGDGQENRLIGQHFSKRRAQERIDRQ